MCMQTVNDVSEDEDLSDSEAEIQEIEHLRCHESDDDEAYEIPNTLPERKGRFIDVDGVSEKIVDDDSDPQKEEEIQKLAARIQYNIKRLKGSPQTNIPLHTDLPPL